MQEGDVGVVADLWHPSHALGVLENLTPHPVALFPAKQVPDCAELTPPDEIA